MIPLRLPAHCETETPYIARLRSGHSIDPRDAMLVGRDRTGATYASRHGLMSVDGADAEALDGDVVLIDPARRAIERVLRAGSRHNTLLVTERCDQLCIMCSQPPRKTHVDRFELLEQASLLAEPGSLIGVSGGEPTLYKDQLLGMIERVLAARADLSFHVLTNGQHFEGEDVQRLRDPRYERVSWGIPSG